MDDTFVFQQIRRAGKNGILFFGALLVFVTLLLFANSRYLYNSLTGPFPITEAQLGSIANVNKLDKYYVIVEGAETAEPIGYDEVGEGERSRIDASYILLGLKENNLLVKSDKYWISRRGGDDMPGPPYTVIGELKTIPKDVEREVLHQHLMRNGSNGKRTLTFMLDAEPFVMWSWICLLLAGLLIIWSLVSILKSIAALKNPESHKAARRLSKFGELNAVVREIEAQVKSAEVKKIGPLVWTKDWLLMPYPVDLKFTKTKDLVWAYKKVTVHRFWFIPIYFTKELTIYDQNHDWYTLSIPDKQIDEFLSQASDRAPWMTLGFDAGAARQWPELASAARERYEEMNRPKA